MVDRRKVLIGLGGTVALAGCIGEPNEGEESVSEPEPDEEAEDDTDSASDEDAHDENEGNDTDDSISDYISTIFSELDWFLEEMVREIEDFSSIGPGSEPANEIESLLVAQFEREEILADIMEDVESGTEDKIDDIKDLNEDIKIYGVDLFEHLHTDFDVQEYEDTIEKVNRELDEFERFRDIGDISEMQESIELVHEMVPYLYISGLGDEDTTGGMGMRMTNDGTSTARMMDSFGGYALPFAMISSNWGSFSEGDDLRADMGGTVLYYPEDDFLGGTHTGSDSEVYSYDSEVEFYTGLIDGNADNSLFWRAKFLERVYANHGDTTGAIFAYDNQAEAKNAYESMTAEGTVDGSTSEISGVELAVGEVDQVAADSGDGPLYFYAKQHDEYIITFGADSEPWEEHRIPAGWINTLLDYDRT